MTPVIVVSVAPFSGKAAVALGLAAKLKADGAKVGWFKPLGPLTVRVNGATTDEDALFVKSALDLKEPLDALCPIPLTVDNITRIMKGTAKDMKSRISESFRAVSADKDVTFVLSMGNLSCGRSIGYSAREMVVEMGAKVLVVDHYMWPVATLDGILQIKEAVGDMLGGVLFNKLSPAKKAQVNTALIPNLTSEGVEVLGALPWC
jgi:hypothetical protein